MDKYLWQKERARRKAIVDEFVRQTRKSKDGRVKRINEAILALLLALLLLLLDRVNNFFIP